MTEVNFYWAEEELGEPYPAQEYSWLGSRHRKGLALGAVTSAVTVVVLVGAAAFSRVESLPRVGIASYERVQSATSIRDETPVPAPSPEAPALASIKPTASPAQADHHADERPLPPAQQSPLVPQIQPAPDHVASATTVSAPQQVRFTRPPSPTRQPRALPESAPAAVASTTDKARSPLAAIEPEKAARPSLANAAPLVKADPETPTGLSKDAEKKPTDIASGEKLGIREILVDGIVMQNGRRVKTGSALPNGEILMGTDAGKAMAETDRRVLVITP